LSVKSLLKKIVLLFVVIVFLGALAFGGYEYKKISASIPNLKKMKEYKPALVTTVYDMNEEKIAEFYVEKRILMDIKEIPEYMKLATLAIEDDNFYHHPGIDIGGILRAALVNLKAGGIVQGGSTITQQVAKLIFLSHERTFKRKFKELILSYEIEKQFSKSEILEIYLNQIYYGHGAYGVEAAAEQFFGRSVKDLTIAEMAMLAGIPKSPNHFSPYKHPSVSLNRRNIVIRRMAELGYISNEDAMVAKDSPLTVIPQKKIVNEAPFFAEHVRRYIEKKYGAKKLYNAGYKIYTTINLEWQKRAQKALKNGIEVTDRRLGYRGPLKWIEPKSKILWGELNPFLVSLDEKDWFTSQTAEGRKYKAVVTALEEKVITININGLEKHIFQSGYEWAHLVDPKKDGKAFKKVKNATDIGIKVGDVIEVSLAEKKGNIEYRLDQTPNVQGALYSTDYTTGAIRAMVGGYDYETSSFNRAIQAKRQPGSSFKPVIYAAALNKGLTPATLVLDAPKIFEDDIGEYKNWKPANFSGKFYGPVTLRFGISHSLNTVSVRVLEKTGINYTIDYARQLGITSPLARDLALGLGASSVSLQELVSVYGVFANKGVRNEPYFIERIENATGERIEGFKENPVSVIDEDIAYQVTTLLQSVVREGTGAKVRGIGVPVGGKTGTTNDFLDSWFLGITPGIATGVWIGKDREESLGKNETGSRASAPIWLNYMKRVVKDMPKKPFTPPSNIVFVKVDKQTGAKTIPGNPHGFFESFIDTKVPKDYEEQEPIS